MDRQILPVAKANGVHKNKRTAQSKVVKMIVSDTGQSREEKNQLDYWTVIGP